MNDVSVVIPSIPPRSNLLERAVKSVRAQTLQPKEIIIEVDSEGLGAAATRNAGLERVTSEFVAFLDDDDELLPIHLEKLVGHLKATGADLVYPGYKGVNESLFKEYHGKPFDDKLKNIILTKKNFIPITVVARTEAIRSVGGFTRHPSAPEKRPLEDHGCWVKMLNAGHVFTHYPHVTWRWHGSKHTSGRPWKQVYQEKKRPQGTSRRTRGRRRR